MELHAKEDERKNRERKEGRAKADRSMDLPVEKQIEAIVTIQVLYALDIWCLQKSTINIIDIIVWWLSYGQYTRWMSGGCVVDFRATRSRLLGFARDHHHQRIVLSQ